jgi:SSS family solute:Na+ symporter
MWIANLYYWGFNQYIIQRALAAKDIRESQKGVVTAAIIKMFVPFIVVLPGIAAYVMKADITKADQAYPWVVNSFVTSGLKGIVVAALVAAIGSSICSMVNSASTIYTLDHTQ